MPRGIPKEKAETEEVKTEVEAKKEQTQEEKIFARYVKGETLSDIARDYKMEPSEVFEIVRSK